jgi:hypothetical protein
MEKRSIILMAFLAVAFVLSAIYPVAAAESTIYILFDNGVNAAMEARQAKSQTNLAQWMSGDLVRVLGRYAKQGYQANLIEKRQEFKAQPDNYLLTVKITEYKPGSKAARIVVGYGAGGVTLKIHYELFAGNKSILADDDSIFSGREWINAARKLNENTAKAVIGKLNK